MIIKCNQKLSHQKHTTNSIKNIYKYIKQQKIYIYITINKH